MERKLFEVRLCAQLDGLGKVWEAQYAARGKNKKVMAFFESQKFGTSIEDVYLYRESRIYDYCVEKADMTVDFGKRANAAVMVEQQVRFAKEVSFGENSRGKLVDVNELADIGQTVKGCMVLGKIHPNYDQHILLPPSRFLTGGSGDKLSKGEIVLIELTVKLCPYGTKWLATEVTTGTAGFITLRDSRYADEGSVILSKYDGPSGSREHVKFKKPFKSNRNHYDEYIDKTVIVKLDEGRMPWAGNQMRIIDGPAEIKGRPCLLDLQGERVDLKKGVNCRIIDRRGDLYVAGLM